MSTTADATVTITCPDWCEYDAETHASDLWTNGGVCLHSGLIAAVEDPTGHGPEWSPWYPDRTIVTSRIAVGVATTTSLDGRPVVTPGIRLVDEYYTVEQIEALIPSLQEAVRLAKEQVWHRPKEES